MIYNNELINSVLAGVPERFNFKGAIKYFPGREVNEAKSKIFESEPAFLKFMVYDIPISQEYILYDREKDQVVFYLDEESMIYQRIARGKFKILEYENRLVEEPPLAVDPVAVINDILRLLANDELINKGQKMNK